MNLDWQTVERLEMRYMRAQLERAPQPCPQAQGGIDETSIRKGHVYRIVVSDLHRQRGRSGSAGRIAPSRAWMSSTGFSGKRRPAECAFIKGQKYALLAHPHNLEGLARKNLKRLLAANRRLNTAYLLKDSFGQM